MGKELRGSCNQEAIQIGSGVSRARTAVGVIAGQTKERVGSIASSCSVRRRRLVYGAKV